MERGRAITKSAEHRYVDEPILNTVFDVREKKRKKSVHFSKCVGSSTKAPRLVYFVLSLIVSQHTTIASSWTIAEQSNFRGRETETFRSPCSGKT